LSYGKIDASYEVDRLFGHILRHRFVLSKRPLSWISGGRP
jgi:hypothetical protein